MILVSYDISNDKARTKFVKFLCKFGFRLQYSVFQINNSENIIDNIKKEIELKYQKIFTENDSILIFDISEACKKIRYGYAKNEEKESFIIT